MKTSTVFIGACGIIAGVLLQPVVICAQASDEAQIRALRTVLLPASEPKTLTRS